MAGPRYRMCTRVRGGALLRRCFTPPRLDAPSPSREENVVTIKRTDVAQRNQQRRDRRTISRIFREHPNWEARYNRDNYTERQLADTPRSQLLVDEVNQSRRIEAHRLYLDLTIRSRSIRGVITAMPCSPFACVRNGTSAVTITLAPDSTAAENTLPSSSPSTFACLG